MDSTLNLSFQGIQVGMMLGILVIMFKQYNIYKGIRERLNILWRVYCKQHQIPYNALGDDRLVDLERDKDNFLRIRD